MDVSEARRGRWLEIDRKEIARRNTLALVTPTERADYHLATPLLATPGEALSESVDLIVVATGKDYGAILHTRKPGDDCLHLIGIGIEGGDEDHVLARIHNSEIASHPFSR